MRKKFLLLPILLLLVLSVLNVSTTGSSAGEYPAIYIDPATTIDKTLTPGDNYTISIKTDYKGTDVWGWQFTLTYNSNVLHGIEVTNSDLITKEKHDSAMFMAGKFDNTAGELSLTLCYFFFTAPDPAPLTYGPGTLANVTFTVVGKGTSDITLGPETKLLGVTGDGYGDCYPIIDAETMPDHVQHGFFCNTAIHDIAVTSVTPSLTRVAAGELIHISVVVENQGTETESFNVTLYYDTTAIETKTAITLVAGANKPLTFAWNTTGILTGTHTIKATASTVPGETDTGDNTGTCDVTVTSLYIAVIPQSTVDPTLTPGKNYTVSIYTDYNGTDIWGYEFTLTYNPSVLKGVEVTNGDLITDETAPITFLPGTFDNTLGELSLTGAFFQYPGKPLPVTSGPGTLANVTFTVVGIGDSDIILGTDPRAPSRLIGVTKGGYGEPYNIIDDIKPDLGHILHGYFKNTLAPVTHDIAVVSVTPSPTLVVAGDFVNITVAVENQGTISETGIKVKVYHDNLAASWLIGTKTVSTLGAGASKFLTFTWNTTGARKGTHTVIAVAIPVHGETDTEDNTLKSVEKVTVLQYEHELAVSLEVPDFLMPGDSTLVNATVYNLGFNETGVELFLLINGTVINNATIPELLSGTSYTIDYLWTPTLETRYNVTAYAPPVPGENITVNNVATKFVRTYPLIRPIEGQRANYTLYYFNYTGELIGTEECNFTYDHYISPYLINITVWLKDRWKRISTGWTVVNIMNRRVESGAGAGTKWIDTWYHGWIETNITLGSTINLLHSTATVVDSRTIEVDGRLVDCWELECGVYTLWHEKASGLLISMECTVYQGPMFGPRSIPFSVLPVAPLDVEVDVGSIRFRGEMAEFYVLVSLMGEPVNASISATLYYNGTLYANLSAYVQYVEIGFYRVPYAIPTDAPTGTYVLVVNASYLIFKGTSLKSFLLSPTLTGTLISINGTLAWIKTEIGTIEGRITSIEGSIATIETDVGTVETLLEGWTGGTTSPITTPQGTFQMLVLTTSTLEEPIAFSDNVLAITLSGSSGTTGTTNIVIPKQLLAGVESSIDKVAVTVDDEQVVFTYTEQPEAYVLQITYTHSTHMVKVYLTGLPPTLFPWALFIVILVLVVIASAGVAVYVLKIRKPRIASCSKSTANLSF